MDPERAFSQPEITPPAHAQLGQDAFVTGIQANYQRLPRSTYTADNLGPFASNPPSSETPSLHHPRNIDPHVGIQPTMDPSGHQHDPESNSHEKETKTKINLFQRFWNFFWNFITCHTEHKDFDWEKNAGKHTAGARLQFTVDSAIIKRSEYAANAKLMRNALNIAIGLQVLLGSLTTGLSAISASGGTSTAKSTTALGALATLVAAFLARARGSGEPELSNNRVEALDRFIRKCRAFQMDQGDITGNKYDQELTELRREFEEILGNVTDRASVPSDPQKKPDPPTDPEKKPIPA